MVEKVCAFAVYFLDAMALAVFSRVQYSAVFNNLCLDAVYSARPQVIDVCSCVFFGWMW
jgi:hypothetical protein